MCAYFVFFSGGFGISPGLLGLMYPAETWVAQISGSTVVRRIKHRPHAISFDKQRVQILEDRHNVAWASPPCQPTQLSVVGASSVSPAGDALTVSWSRPLVVNATLLAEGYINVPQGSTHAIGAILYGKAPAPYTFNATLTRHTTPGTVPVKFQ